MPIDASIPLQVRLPEQPNVLAQYAQIAGIQNAGMQNKLAQVQYENALRSQQDEDNMREGYRSALNPDTGELNRNTLVKNLAQRGAGARIPDVLAKFATLDKEQAALEKVKIETELKRLDILSPLVAGLVNDPNLTHDKVLAAGKRAEALGAVPKGWEAGIPMNAMELPAYVRSLALATENGRKSLAMILPHVTFHDTGGSVAALNDNTLAGPVGPLAGVAPVAKTNTPGELLTDARTKSEGAANRGVTMRGQNMTDARAQEGLNIRKVEADPMGMLGINKSGLGGVAPTAAQPSPVTGDALLQTIPKPVADQVKALAEGRMAFPAGFALKSPYWQNMISLVSQYDPNFDAVNYNARASTRKDFTSGKSANNLTAINTAIGHLQSLSDAAEKLNNTSIQPVNSIINKAKEMTGNPNINSFDMARNAVGDELMRVFRQVGASETEARSWKETISRANSPAQFKSSIAQAGDLLESRISALNDTYGRGMGTTADTLQMVSPKSRQVLNKLKSAQAQSSGAGWTVEKQ